MSRVIALGMFKGIMLPGIRREYPRSFYDVITSSSTVHEQKTSKFTTDVRMK